MDDTALYTSNLNRWSLFSPKAAEKLKQSFEKNSDLQSETDESGNLTNLKLVLNGEEFLFHDAENPIDEAKEWIKEIDLNAFQVIYVYGVGLGYAFEALKEWLDNARHFLVFIEDQLPVIDIFLHSERASRILVHSQVWLYFYESDKNELERFTVMFAAEQPKMLTLPLYKKLYEHKSNELHVSILFLRNLQQVHVTEFANYGSGFFSNYFQNLFVWPSAYHGDGLFGKFHSVPAIICGAGPSLKKNIDLLSKLTDRALIFAGGTAMNAVNAKGLLPHFGIGIDPNFEQSTRIIMNKAFDIPFFYRSRINNVALNIVGGDPLYLSGNTGYEIANYFDSELGISSTDLEEGCNVINLSLSVAEKMGCNPIILVGVDLAYSDNHSYAEGVTNHPIHATKKLFRTKEDTEELITYDDIHGQPVLTLWKWITESLWFSHFATEHAEIKLINATEGGIGFNGVPNLTLQEVAEQYLSETFDFQTRVFGEIQTHSMPAQATASFIRKMIEEFAASLERCVLKIKHEADSLVNLSIDNIQNRIKPISELLEDEIAYMHLLKLLEAAFDTLHLRQSKRIEIDAEFFSPIELEHKRRELQIQRYNYLIKAGVAIRNIIEYTLQKQKIESTHLENRSEDLTHNPSLIPPDTSTYVFENGRFTINDSELGLKHHESFILGEDILTQKVLAENGDVKHLWHMQQGKLHGPSLFYGPNQQILTQCWYIDGLLQGKVFQYFASGALYGIQRYQYGQRHGKQERYYENGVLRSLLSYDHGQLHGEQALYHRNSTLARSLSFVHDKRHGLERIWKDSGQLVIEAEFNKDLPIGTAKVWYDDGALAQESIYSDDGKILQTKRLDRNGHPLDDSIWNRLDYFEDIARQTGMLTDSLAGIFDSVALAAPLVAEAGNQKTALQQSKELEEDFKKLTKELDNLRSLQDQMLFESGLDEKNPQEAIWKSPSVKRELQLKLDSMTKELHEGVSKLQSSFGQTLEELKKIQDLKDHHPNPSDEKKT